MQLASTSSWRDWCANASPFSSSAGPPSIEGEREFVRSLREPPCGVIFVAVSGDAIIGLLDFHSEKRPQAAHGGQFGMSVASDWRGQGVGSALLAALLSWADDHSVTRLELQVFEINHQAIRLYERIGFQTEGRRRRAVVVGGTLSTSCSWLGYRTARTRLVPANKAFVSVR